MSLESRLLAFAQAIGADVKALRSPGVHCRLPVSSGGYMSAVVNGGALTTVTCAAQRLDLMPFIPTRTVVVNELAIEVTNLLALATALVGVYSDVGGTPTALLAGGTTSLDCTLAGVKTQAISSLTMTAGTTYWLAMLANGLQGVRAVPLASLVDLSSAASGGSFNTLRRGTVATMTLPAIAPTTVPTSAVAPWIRLRVA